MTVDTRHTLRWSGAYRLTPAQRRRFLEVIHAAYPCTPFDDIPITAVCRLVEEARR